MGVQDGRVKGISKIIDNGPVNERYNLVLVSEGYKASELPVYKKNAKQFVKRFFSYSPLDEYKKAFNVYRVDVTSKDSGADDPKEYGGTGATAATYFDAAYGKDKIRRLLYVDDVLVINTVKNLIPEWHEILVIVNSPIPGGGSGGIAVSSTSERWEETTIHELGHEMFGLADEYEYRRGYNADEGFQDYYWGWEPAKPNVTINTDRMTIKWANLIDNATKIPTTKNVDCSKCDPQESPVPEGTIGLFEGAYYHHCAIFRPAFNCIMRRLSFGFCAVCQQQIRIKLQPYMPPD